MKLRLLTVMLSVMLGFMPLSAVRLDPESHAYLSDPKYEKHIDVQCYLVTREQLAEVIAKPQTQVQQKTNKDLYDKSDLFLLVRCKNMGIYVAAGDINCYLTNWNGPIPITVGRMHSKNVFYDYAIFIGNNILTDDNQLPQIKYEWDCLYTM